MNEPRQETAPSCPICGGTTFVPGPIGRMTAKGLAPSCAECGSLERHRIVRQVYDAIASEILEGARALQFSNDPAAPRDRFKSFETSIYGIDNSLDMTSIERPDGCYDWVIANHVLEHIEDDFAAIRELLRIVSREGVIQLTVPSPAAVLETWDVPDPHSWDSGHRRGYGSDLPMRFAVEFRGCFGLQVVCTDDQTGRWDIVYLFTKSHDTLTTIGNALISARLPTLRCV